MNLKKLFQGTLLRLSLSLSIYPLFGKKAQPHFLPGGFFLTQLYKLFLKKLD